MNLQYLKYFITLAEYKNFTKAAEKNFVVQSTFSAGIKKLEEMLDCQLFYRDKRNVNLTKDGEKLLPKAKEMLSLWNTMESSNKNEVSKVIKIGVLDNIHNTDLVMPVLKNFKELYQAYTVELKEGKQEELLSQLKKKELDVIFIQDVDIEGDLFAKSVVSEEKVEVMLHTSHELRDRKQLKLEELDGLPFIEHGNCVLAQKVYQILNEKNLHLNTVFSAQNSDMLSSLVAANMGVSLMAKPKSYSDSVVFIPLADAEFKRVIVMVWNPKNPSEVLQRFLIV